MITLLSLLNTEERRIALQLNPDLYNSIFLDTDKKEKTFDLVNVGDLIKLANMTSIFDEPYTDGVFLELYKRYGVRCQELKHKLV